jgi:bifunctional oligoribonuclease and PAP phosphatase NrnA
LSDASSSHKSSSNCDKDEMLIESWSRLIEHRSVVIACHERPDGDTLGSALGMAHILRNMGKEVTVLSVDGVPENYHFIPESKTVLASTYRRDYDLGILMDSESEKRVGSAFEAVDRAKVTACIDHHIPEHEYGDIRVVDRTSASTAEVAVELLEANNVKIDAVAASQFMTGLIADTGAFRFANTTPHTFEIAAHLTSLGADPSYISEQVFDCRPLRAIKLLGRALDSIKINAEGTVAYAVITRQDMDSLGAGDNDSESIVNYVGMVSGVIIYMLFREIETNNVRVSLRSRDGFDVNRIARVFDGGGHRTASGCTIFMSIEDAVVSVLKEVDRCIDSDRKI